MRLAKCNCNWTSRLTISSTSACAEFLAHIAILSNIGTHLNPCSQIWSRQMQKMVPSALCSACFNSSWIDTLTNRNSRLPSAKNSTTTASSQMSFSFLGMQGRLNLIVTRSWQTPMPARRWELCCRSLSTGCRVLSTMMKQPMDRRLLKKKKKRKMLKRPIKSVFNANS